MSVNTTFRQSVMRAMTEFARASAEMLRVELGRFLKGREL